MTGNGKVPNLKPGILLLPQPTNGEKWGIDDFAAKRGWEIGEFNSFIYPMHEVFDVETGKFIAYESGLLSPPQELVPGNGDNKTANLLPVLTVAEFLLEAPESYDWISEGIVAKGAVTKFAGKAKESGKTTFLMCMVADVLNGTAFLGKPTKKSRVLFLSEQASNLREALKDADIDDPNVEGLILLPSHLVPHLDWKELTRMIRAYCVAESIDLLVVDTLVDFSDVEDTEENSSGKVKGTIKPLKHLAQSHKVAVVFTQHHNLENRGRGSTQFDAEPDILIDLFAPDQVAGDLDPNMRQLRAKGRGVDYARLVKFTKENGYEACDSSDETMTKLDRKAKTVLRFLPVLEADARTIDDLVKALEGAGKAMSRSTVIRALKDLMNEDLALEKGEGGKKDPKRYWRASGTEDDEETKGTSLLSPNPDTRGEVGDNKTAPGNVVPIRLGINAEEPKKKGKPTPEELAERVPGYVHTENRLQECFGWVKARSEVSIDVETKGKNKNESLLYTKATIRLISLHHGEESWFLDCDHLDDGDVAVLLKQLEDKPKYFHNSAFDVPRIYRRFGVLLNKNVRDTLVASRTARAGEWEEVRDGNKAKRPKKDHDLRECLKRELGVQIPKTKQKWSGPLTDEHLLYAGDDVAYLKGLYDALYERIEGLGIKTAYDAIAATMHMFLESVALGVPVDAGTLEAIQTEVGKEKGELESRLKELAPEHPEGLEWKWRNSDKDTRPEGKGRAGVHRMLQLVGVKLPNLEEQTLLDNREKHALVKALYEYRKVAAAHSKYRRILEDFYEDGRIYPQVKMAGAVTSRVLYSEPNIQGFDKKKTDRYRKCVRAEEGYYVVKGDFAQQELRIAAYFSEDEALMTAFANDEDVYMRVAKKIAGKSVKRGTEDGDKARAAAKRAVLGYLYGLGPEKYRKNVYKDTGVEISLEEAKRDREAFRSAYPGFYKWQKSYGFHKDETNLPKEDMWETRSVRGWRRVVEGNYERKSEWKKEHGVAATWVPKYTERLNGPIQSTAGDILYLTLGKLDADLSSGLYPGTRFLFTAHDEVVLTCPEGDARDVAAWLKSRMVEALEQVLGPELGGPGSVEVGGGSSWGEIEKWA